MKPVIYLLPIIAVNAYVASANPDSEGGVEALRTLSRADCANILFEHERLNGTTPAGAYCPEMFQEQFNYALDRDRISSDDYFIKVFA